MGVAGTCSFCKIARGEAHADIVFEDGASIAFLDHRPLFPGHCLLIPRTHHATLADVPAPLLGAFFASVQLLACAVERAFAADGSFVAVNNRVSQSVPHLHVHVVPRRFKDGLRGFFWPRRPYADRQAALDARSAIIAAIGELARPIRETKR